MAIWNDCTMQSYYGGEGSTESPCVVRIGGGRIVVEYQDSGRTHSYTGSEEGPGHFRLTSPTHNASGTLHMFPNEDVLVGEWEENGQEGLWRIHLDGFVEPRA